MSVYYIPVRVYLEGRTVKAEADAEYAAAHPVVTGNSVAFGVALTFEGDGWEGFTRYVRIVAVSLESEEHEYLVSGGGTDNVLFPPIYDAVTLRVYVERGDRITEFPAAIPCAPGITDNSGIEDEPRPDVYNLMLEYIAQRRSGSQSRADALLAELYELRESAPPAYPGDDYRLTAKRAERVTKVTGKLTLADNTKISVTDDMISSNTLKLTTEAVSNDALMPGGVPSTELQATLRLSDLLPGDLYEARLELTYHIQRHDEHWCDIDLGSYTVTEAKSPEPGRMQITGFDDMLKLTRLPRSSFVWDPFKDVYTFSETVKALADEAGVAWDGVMPASPIEGDEWPVIKPELLNNGIETGRDLLSWIAQAVSATAIIDPHDQTLHLIRYAVEAPVESYTEGDSLSHSISGLMYVLHAIHSTILEYDWNNNASGAKAWEELTLWTQGVTAEMPENLLSSACWYQYDTFDFPENGATFLQYAAILLDPVIFTPGSVETFGDPALRLLEWIEVRTEAGDAEFPITRTEWTYRGSHKIESGGTEAVAGMEKSLAEKRDLGARVKAWNEGQSETRRVILMFIQTDGHLGMSNETHATLHHFTHKELGTRGEW